MYKSLKENDVLTKLNSFAETKQEQAESLHNASTKPCAEDVDG